MNFSSDLSYLSDWAEYLDLDRIYSYTMARNRKLLDPQNSEFVKIIEKRKNLAAQKKDYSGSVVSIGDISEISADTATEISKELHLFDPWRKGPFRIFGIEVDAEWRSDYKWDRLEPFLEDLGGKKVCDLGCNNGYFMYRMLRYQPELVLGLDPTRKYKLMFEYLQNFSREERLHFELLGFEHLHHFPSFFDTIFCMGIVYHHRSPMYVLENCNRALKKGGQILLESMGISGDDPVSLTPENRYAKMRNVWFIPTWKTMEIWLSRAGFGKIECVYNEVLSTGEQRQTPWAQVDSLEQFLDPLNPDLTAEGYERPSRIYLSATKIREVGQ